MYDFKAKNYEYHQRVYKVTRQLDGSVTDIRNYLMLILSKDTKVLNFTKSVVCCGYNASKKVIV